MAPIPIGIRLAELAAHGADDSAVTCDDQTVTFGALRARTVDLAAAYRDLGVRAGDMVTVALPNGIEFVEACCALWTLGAVPQPVSWRLPARERDQIMDLAGSVLIVGAEPSLGAERPTVPPGFTPPMPAGTPVPADAVAPHWKAITSGGSTGRPKLIVADVPGVFDPSANRLGPAGTLRPDDVQLVPGPLYHNAPFVYCMTGLLLGQHVVVMARFNADDALDAITRHRVTWANLVPTMMLRMLRSLEAAPDRWDLSSMVYLWHMAAPCPAWLKRAWIDLLGPDRIFELYGGSDSPTVTTIDGAEWLRRPGSVGRPVAGEIRVVGPDGTPRPAGVVGEIFMRKAAGAPDLYHYVGAEMRAMEGGWQSIGDLGHLDGDGYLYISDRRADMIVTGGANVYPAEVEAAILEHPAAASCVVVGLPDNDLGQRVHAVVEVSAPVTDADLANFVADRLVRYKVPRSFRLVRTSLRDDAGKVRRSQVRDDEVARAATSTGAAPTPD